MSSGFGLQLNPWMSVRVPPDIDAWAIIMIDRGKDAHLEWVIFIPEGPNAGALFVMENPAVRVNTCLTCGWDELRPFTPEEYERWKFLLPEELEGKVDAP